MCKPPPPRLYTEHELTAARRTQIIGSFSQAYCFPRAVAYLDGGKVNVKGMVRIFVSLCTV